MSPNERTQERQRMVARQHRFFTSDRSGDEYDRNAITHVMGCASHFPGEFVNAP